MKNYLYLLLFIGALGCVSDKRYTYQVHLVSGDGAMHLYTGHDYEDAISYMKEYEKSHGDMKLVPVPKD